MRSNHAIAACLHLALRGAASPEHAVVLLEDLSRDAMMALMQLNEVPPMPTSAPAVAERCVHALRAAVVMVDTRPASATGASPDRARKRHLHHAPACLRPEGRRCADERLVLRDHGEVRHPESRVAA